MNGGPRQGRWRRRPSFKASTALVLALALPVAGVGWMTWMPGKSAGEPLPPLGRAERALAGRLAADVSALSDGIGERNLLVPGSLDAAAAWIRARLEESGDPPDSHTYELRLPPFAGERAENLVVEIPGGQQWGEVVVVGAHYDSVPGSPGANDNASGVAVLLALAEWFRERPQARSLRFVFFANEEPPHFLGPDMGSHAYAALCRDRGDDIRAMIALDGLGYYSSEPGSQHFPLPGIGLIYPDRGNFIGFVTRVRDGRLLRRALRAFRGRAGMLSEGAALPGGIAGVGWSDHWSFWRHGYSAFLVTDTLPFRDPHYHSPRDSADRLDYERMARVVAGLKAVIAELADPG